MRRNRSRPARQSTPARNCATTVSARLPGCVSVNGSSATGPRRRLPAGGTRRNHAHDRMRHAIEHQRTAREIPLRAKHRRHSPSLTSATRGLPNTSSSTVKTRPRIGVIPRRGKRSAETRAPIRRSGSPLPVRTKPHGRYAATRRASSPRAATREMRARKPVPGGRRSVADLADGNQARRRGVGQ